VVTTPGDYLYLGQLEVDFDAAGEVIHVGQASGPRRVVGGTYADAVGEDAWVKTNVVTPVAAYVSALGTTVVGKVTVGLNGLRSDVRTKATNLGALAADALLWQSWQLRGTYGFDSAVISLQNGGGIRNNSVLATGDLSLATLFDVAPFGNMFAMYPRLPVTVLKDALENAYRGLPSAAGQFGQIGGATVWVDIAQDPMTVNASGALVTHGKRVVQLVLDRGDTLVKNGVVVDSTRKVPFVTIDFLARGGDGFPLAKDSFIVAPIPQHQVLRNYIQTGLAGTVDSVRYPQGFAGRVIIGTTGPVSVLKRHAVVPSVRLQGGMVVARMELSAAGAVDLELLDLSGRQVGRVSRQLSAGVQSLSLGVSGHSRGIYLVRVRTSEFSKVLPVQILH
jgi:5'-nucleotidase